MRLTEFWARMDLHLGHAYARTWAVIVVSVSGGVYDAEPGPVGDPLSAPCTTP